MSFLAHKDLEGHGATSLTWDSLGASLHTFLGLASFQASLAQHSGCHLYPSQPPWGS